jgi:adenylylsulfate kinase-like enzyme
MTPAVLVPWLTGLPCSGKSTLAVLLAEALVERGSAVQVLDGDALRRTVCADLGFSHEARIEQARRTARLAAHALRRGEQPIVALISPSVASRTAARVVLGGAMAEIHLDAPVSVCEARDVKGMYARESCRTSPAYPRRTSRPTIPRCVSTPSWRRPTSLRDGSWSSCGAAASSAPARRRAAAG